MEQDTVSLLKEVDSGCKMAMDSLAQVRDSVKDTGLRRLLDEYDITHAKIGEQCMQQLHAYGKQDKDPGLMAKMMARIETGMKTINDPDNRKVVGLLMDGCSMGIRTLSSAMNQYSAADEKSRKLAHDLIDAEQTFIDKLKAYA